MASVRHTLLIDATADAAWAELTDPVAIANWWAGVADAKMTDRGREVRMDDGVQVIEHIVTNDSAQRRLQYSVYDGDLHKLETPMAEHMSTIDVIDVEGTTLIVYSLDVKPDMFGELLSPQIAAGLQSLKDHLEG